MPLYCSNTGSTALRDADVQQPITDAHLSCTRSFFAFSAKVGQSLAPSSWMNLILRPSTPPLELIWSIASFSASTEPVSRIAVAERAAAPASSSRRVGLRRSVVHFLDDMRRLS